MAEKERAGRDGIVNEGSGRAKRKGTDARRGGDGEGYGVVQSEGCYCRLHGARVECNTRGADGTEREPPPCTGPHPRSFGRPDTGLSITKIYTVSFVC